AGGIGQNTSGFPATYGIVRAGKFKRLAISKLQACYGFARKILPKIGFPRAGFAAAGDDRTFAAQNYHCAAMGLNISMSISRPPPGGLDGMRCLSCPTTHEFRDKLE
ncbi:hypothetical protein, partial [Salmonella enterica]|uniref:hypothetical protein n=1 Tax=Salmonella enterica TaxID=28901 RepID=UPI003525AC92